MAGSSPKRCDLGTKSCLIVISHMFFVRLLVFVREAPIKKISSRRCAKFFLFKNGPILSAIATEEALIQTKLITVEVGDTILKKEKYGVINERLKTLSQQYEKENCLQFLRNTGEIFHR